MPDFSHARKGDRKINTRAFNTMMDVAKAFTEATRRGLSEPFNIAAFLATTIVDVRNDTGIDLEVTDVMGIDAPLFDPEENVFAFLDRVTFSGIVPTYAGQRGRFVICAEPIAAGEIGKCYAAGVFPCYVYLNDFTHLYADVQEGDTNALDSDGVSGAVELLWTPVMGGVSSSGDPGLHYCIGRMATRKHVVHPLLLDKVDGSPGVAQISPCTYRYNLFSIADTDLEHPLNDSPVSLTGMGNGWRNLYVPLVAAAYGDGYRDPSDGTWILTNAHEGPASEQDCGS